MTVLSTDLLVAAAHLVSPLGRGIDEHAAFIAGEVEPAARSTNQDTDRDAADEDDDASAEFVTDAPVAAVPWIPADAVLAVRVGVLAAQAARGAIAASPVDADEVILVLPGACAGVDAAAHEVASGAMLAVLPPALRSRVRVQTSAAGALLEAARVATKGSAVLVIAADSLAAPEVIEASRDRSSSWDAPLPRAGESAAALVLAPRSAVATVGVGALRAVGAARGVGSEDDDESPDGAAMTELLRGLPRSGPLRWVFGPFSTSALARREWDLGSTRAHARLDAHFRDVSFEHEVGRTGGAQLLAEVAYALGVARYRGVEEPLLVWGFEPDGTRAVCVLGATRSAARARVVPAAIVGHSSPPQQGALAAHYADATAGVAERLALLGARKWTGAFDDQAETEARVLAHLDALERLGARPLANDEEGPPGGAWAVGLVAGSLGRDEVLAATTALHGEARWAFAAGVATSSLSNEVLDDLARRAGAASIAIEALSLRGAISVADARQADPEVAVALGRAGVRLGSMPAAVLVGVRAAMEIEALAYDAIRILCLSGDSRLLGEIRTGRGPARLLGASGVDLLALFGFADDEDAVMRLLGRIERSEESLRAAARYGYPVVQPYLLDALRDDELADAAGEALVLLRGDVVEEDARLDPRAWARLSAFVGRVRRGAPLTAATTRGGFAQGDVDLPQLRFEMDELRLHSRLVSATDPSVWGDEGRAQLLAEVRG